MVYYFFIELFLTNGCRHCGNYMSVQSPIQLSGYRRRNRKGRRISPKATVFSFKHCISGLNYLLDIFRNKYAIDHIVKTFSCEAYSFERQNRIWVESSPNEFQ